MEWKNINNCPVDTLVLFDANDYCVSVDSDVCIGYMNERMEYFGVSNDKELFDIPTHWMPLPLRPIE